MTLTPEQVERVVAEVVRRLTKVERFSESFGSGTPVSDSQDSESRATTGGTLHIREHLVTMATLDGRLASATRLIVPQRAIVTPQVRDELKKRQIELVRCDRMPSAIAEIRLLVAADSASREVLKGLTGLMERAEVIESGATSCLTGTVKELSRHIAARRTPGLFLTEQPFAAVAAAYAAGQVAAHVRSAAEVAQAKTETKTHLFVIEAAKLQRQALARVAAAIG
jgi:hypothetical protein